MSYETITIPVDPNKENLSKIDIPPISESYSTLKSIYGDYKFTSLNPQQKIILDHKMHPVFEGYLWAYKNHRPITISPDIIWLLVIQAFANHVSENGEELRSKLVNFKGNHPITVKRPDINFTEMNAKDWESLIPEFTHQISKYTGDEIIDTLTASFSTTTSVSLAVSQLTIMSTLNYYFNYKMNILACGFPHITIEGSVSDWRKIIDKLTFLSSFKFDWFTKKVTSIVRLIIGTIKGNVNKEFWKRMIRIDYKGDCDPSFIDGWLTYFFPFAKDGSRITSMKIDTRTLLQDEMHEIPFMLDLIKGDKHEMQFLAGFVGLSQDEKTGSIKPEIGWFIQEKKVEPVYVPDWLYERKKISGVIIEDYEKRVCYQKLLVETEKLIFAPQLLQTTQLTQTRQLWQSSVLRYNPRLDLFRIESFIRDDIEKAKIIIKERIYMAKKVEINIQMLCKILNDPNSFTQNDFDALQNDNIISIDMNVIEKELANPKDYLSQLEKNKWLSETIPKKETSEKAVIKTQQKTKVVNSKTAKVVNKVQPRTKVVKPQSKVVRGKPPTTTHK